MMKSARLGRGLLVCAIAGSLRKASYNRALLRVAQEVAPADMEIRIFERIGELPHYDEDVERLGDPEPVAALKRAIAEADHRFGVDGREKRTGLGHGDLRRLALDHLIALAPNRKSRI